MNDNIIPIARHPRYRRPGPVNRLPVGKHVVRVVGVRNIELRNGRGMVEVTFELVSGDRCVWTWFEYTPGSLAASYSLSWWLTFRAAARHSTGTDDIIGAVVEAEIYERPLRRGGVVRLATWRSP